MQRAMAKQAEAERERRAKVINADGEFQAAAKLSEAAEVLTRHPIAVQLRYLQTTGEIASERSTTTFFPLPLDLFGPLLQAFDKGGDGPKAGGKIGSFRVLGGLAQLAEERVRNYGIEGS